MHLVDQIIMHLRTAGVRDEDIDFDKLEEIRRLMNQPGEDWHKALPCHYNHGRECLAKIPAACLCAKELRDEGF